MTIVERPASVSDAPQEAPDKKKGWLIAAVIVVAALVGFGIWLFVRDDGSTTDQATTDETATVQPAAESDGSAVAGAVMAASELEEWESEAVTFFDRFYEGWPDLEARFSEFADDAVFYDPTFGDYFVGPAAMRAGWAMMPGTFPELDASVKSVFLSADGAVFSADWVGFWLGEKPDDVPWPAGLEVFGFDGNLVASQDLWYAEETLEGVPVSCGGCSADVRAAADRYVMAWSSGDPGQIAALYSDDAALRDTMFGIEASGADEIGQSVTERFGSGEGTMTIEEIYGVTVHGSLIPSGSPSNHGDVAGVGIRYQWTPDVGGTSTTMDSLVLFHFGRIEAGKFVSDHTNLIVREEVFHNPDSLMELMT